MSAKPSPNKFAAALKPPTVLEPPAVMPNAPDATEAEKPALKHPRPSREGRKLVGGHFDPAVSKQVRTIALAEDTTVQALVAEALDLLFQARRMPTIAQDQKEV